MRAPIAVNVESYNIDHSEPAINSTVKAFAEYLQYVQVGRNTRSKYGLLGPAGKTITELKAGRHDRDSLIGYTLRVQESARPGQFRPEIRPESIRALERAVDGVLSVLKEAPEPFHAAILDRLDYGLYYRLRRAQIEGKEAARLEWVTFVRNKYGCVEAVSTAWGRPVQDIQTFKLQSRVPKGWCTRTGLSRRC